MGVNASGCADGAVAIYIDPPTHHFLNDRLFDSSTNPLSGDNLQAPFIAVRDYFAARGIPVHTADLMTGAGDDVRKIYVSMGRVGNYALLSRRPDIRLSAFFALECPIVEPTLYSVLPSVQRYVCRIMCFSDPQSLLPFTGRLVTANRFVWPQCLDAIAPDAWSRRDRAFLTMINANKLPRVYRDELYTARLRAVEYFHRFGEIDLYGKGWDRAPMRVGKTWIPATARRIYAAAWLAWQRRRPDPLYAAVRAASRGTVASKAETLGGYTFAICFENMVLPGWITEKLFDCLAAGCVPVYWGAPDIATVVPASCFIDMRRFAGFAELRQFLHALTQEEVDTYRDAGRAFLESAQFDRFRTGAFVQHFRQFLREDLGVET